MSPPTARTDGPDIQVIAARQPEAIDTSTSHIGFRCVAR